MASYIFLSDKWPGVQKGLFEKAVRTHSRSQWLRELWLRDLWLMGQWLRDYGWETYGWWSNGWGAKGWGIESEGRGPGAVMRTCKEPWEAVVQGRAHGTAGLGCALGICRMLCWVVSVDLEDKIWASSGASQPAPQRWRWEGGREEELVLNTGAREPCHGKYSRLE